MIIAQVVQSFPAAHGLLNQGFEFYFRCSSLAIVSVGVVHIDDGELPIVLY